MKFALITEGPSEHRIIKHIINKYFKDREPEINQIQPKIVNDKQITVGGWNEVLKYCSREELNDILIENDYLIIQIDTDQSQTKPFNVNHMRLDNTLKSAEELFADVTKRIRGLIKNEILESYNDRIFFAICIHTIECWLLPICYNNHHRSDIRNCLRTLNAQLKRDNIHIIPTTDKNSAYSIRIYERLLSNWRNRRDIQISSQYNTSFNKFIEQINTI